MIFIFLYRWAIRRYERRRNIETVINEPRETIAKRLIEGQGIWRSRQHHCNCYLDVVKGV